MTDPRIAPLAAALNGTIVWAGPPVIIDRESSAAAILAALDAAGWAVTNDPSILLVIKERLAFRDRAEAAEAEIARLRTEAERGCWTWPRALTGEGYGSLRVGGRTMLAHRVSFEALSSPIPDGMTIDHLCRNRACVRPDHMEVVLIGENIRRGTSPSAINARKAYCPKGHPLDAENTHIWRGKRSCKACQRRRVRMRREAGMAG